MQQQIHFIDVAASALGKGGWREQVLVHAHGCPVGSGSGQDQIQIMMQIQIVGSSQQNKNIRCAQLPSLISGKERSSWQQGSHLTNVTAERRWLWLVGLSIASEHHGGAQRAGSPTRSALRASRRRFGSVWFARRGPSAHARPLLQDSETESGPQAPFEMAASKWETGPSRESQSEPHCQAGTGLQHHL